MYVCTLLSNLTVMKQTFHCTQCLHNSVCFSVITVYIDTEFNPSLLTLLRLNLKVS